MSERELKTRLDDVAAALATLSRDGLGLTLVGEGSVDAPLLVVKEGVVPASIDRVNCLVDAEIGASFIHVTKLLGSEGFLSPLDGLVADETVASWVARGPAFVELFVSAFDGVTRAGEALRTARAPRHAVGPDVGGAAILSPPVVAVLRARLRLARADAAAWWTYSVKRVDDAVAAVAAVMDRGLAFAVQADASVVRVLGPAHVAPTGATADAPVPPQLARGPRTGAMLAPDDTKAMRAALVGGEILVGVPHLGRLARFAESPTVDVRLGSVHAGAAALALALEVSDVA